jgi:tRNA 2-thiouridine synthesizing protein A
VGVNGGIGPFAAQGPPAAPAPNSAIRCEPVSNAAILTRSLQKKDRFRMAFDEATDPGVTSLDAVGLKCPLPVLKARKTLAGLAPGAMLEVLADDPGAAQDFEAFCQATGHRLIAQGAASGVQRFLIQKPADNA